MNFSNIVQAGITLLLTLAPWFVPDWKWQYKLIFALFVLLLSVSVSWISLFIKLKRESKKRHEIESRHDALAHQFDEKRKQERRYRKLIKNLNLVLHLALLDEDKAKLEDVYRIFLLEQEELGNGGASDGKNNQNREDHQ